MSQKIMVKNSDDVIIWERLKNVPRLSKPIAIFCLLINIILPGIGTIIAACMTEEETVSKTQVVVGVIQFVMTVLIVGYFWSWYWGYLFVAKAFEIGEFATSRMPGGTSMHFNNQKNLRGGGEFIQFGDEISEISHNNQNKSFRHKGEEVPIYDVVV